MEVSEKAARDLLTELGVENADGMKEKFLVRNLNAKLPEVVSSAKSEPTGDNLVLLKRITSALEEGETITLESDGASPKPKKEKKGKSEKDLNKSKKSEKMKTKPSKKSDAKAKAVKGKKADKTKPDKAKKGEKVSGEKKGRKKSGKSGLDAAYRVLKETKKPLNRKDLVDKIISKGYWESPGGKTPSQTIAAAIYMEIKNKGKESRFKVAERGLFTVAGKDD